MTKKGTQYTIRGVKPDIDRALRGVAESRSLSLNAYLVKELERIAEQASEDDLHHDLDFVIGSMSDHELVDKALKDFEKIDEELWK